MTERDSLALLKKIRHEAQRLGFSDLAVAPLNKTDSAMTRYCAWIDQAYHGEMGYLAKHVPMKRDPTQLLSAAKVAIMVRMDYAPNTGPCLKETQSIRSHNGVAALVANYAQGRDYHKVVKKQLQKLVHYIESLIGPFGYRVFTDSGPVLEVELATQAGLGWRGKNTLLLSRTGSWFFLGEVLVDLDFPVGEPVTSHCGACQQCLDVCPSQAFVAPYVLDATRCISYLTIEHKGSIDPELRPLIGTRIYGCDDCQTVCPWNKFAQTTTIEDFKPRHELDTLSLLEAWSWTDYDFDIKTQGSPIRRIGYEQWLRNVAVALGNAPSHPDIVPALLSRSLEVSELVKEHIDWALSCHAVD